MNNQYFCCELFDENNVRMYAQISPIKNAYELILMLHNRPFDGILEQNIFETYDAAYDFLFKECYQKYKIIEERINNTWVV